MRLTLVALAVGLLGAGSLQAATVAAGATASSSPKPTATASAGGQTSPTPTVATATPVKFDVYWGYFVSNKFEPQAPASFVVLQDQKAFDEVFGVGMVMGDQSHRLPPKAFESLMVIAPIKRGKAFWSFTVESCQVAGGVLTLRYSAMADPGNGAEYSCPLIVSVPKGAYTAVEFVEGVKTVKKIDLAAPPAPAKGTGTAKKG